MTMKVDELENALEGNKQNLHPREVKKAKEAFVKKRLRCKRDQADESERNTILKTLMLKVSDFALVLVEVELVVEAMQISGVRHRKKCSWRKLRTRFRA
ncbi:hypothetical protein PsorP6_004001 [Peronosclerospora sorghi]|uniref:Uncharacterized protein n=1 Tax=Peronosclerospora sorghi TaxID=230839 RepID=A0ACC0VQK5_9STRA|nr:hypothetical protein PsorP6_004001 [Peronosclerospora sorghi]